jgi:tRNA U55 pseudouridine synthase TruB
MTVKDTNGKKKPLWVLAKNNQLKDVAIPKKTVTVYSIENLGFEYLPSTIIKETLIRNVSSLTSGQFRQKEILSQWESFPYLPSYSVLTMNFFVSSGTYIRQLVKDFSRDLNHPLMVLDLHRLSFS